MSEELAEYTTEQAVEHTNTEPTSTPPVKRKPGFQPGHPRYGGRLSAKERNRRARAGLRAQDNRIAYHEHAAMTALERAENAEDAHAAPLIRAGLQAVRHIAEELGEIPREPGQQAQQGQRLRVVVRERPALNVGGPALEVGVEIGGSDEQGADV